MRIAIQGKHHKVNHAIIRRALQWYAKDLLPALTTKICLDLEISANLQRDEGIQGAATWLHTAIRPRHFAMELDANLDLRNTLKILAHEMVHVKQFARGELIDLENTSAATWQGKRYRIHDDDRYWTLPWEIEAYGREPGLYHRFRKLTGI